MLRDFRTAPISAPERALFEFLEKMNRNSVGLGPEDIAAVLRAGWTEEAVYDALTVCALFNFYNKWIDASGVHDLPAAAYLATGERLASQGYATNPAPEPAGGGP